MTEAVERLYSAFAHEPRPVRVEGCTNCCISEEELDMLVRFPREQLGAEDLRSYASNAADTVGAEADFRYFLPRLLEVASSGELEWPDHPWVVRRLRFVPWREWDRRERDAIRTYLRTWWSVVITEPVERDDLDEVLSSLSLVDSLDEFPRYLQMWIESGRTAKVRLARFIVDNSMRLALGKKWDSWSNPDAVLILYEWLYSGLPLQALLVEFEQNSEGREGELLLNAAALL